MGGVTYCNFHLVKIYFTVFGSCKKQKLSYRQPILTQVRLCPKPGQQAPCKQGRSKKKKKKRTGTTKSPQAACCRATMIRFWTKDTPPPPVVDQSKTGLPAQQQTSRVCLPSTTLNKVLDATHKMIDTTLGEPRTYRRHQTPPLPPSSTPPPAPPKKQIKNMASPPSRFQGQIPTQILLKAPHSSSNSTRDGHRFRPHDHGVSHHPIVRIIHCSRHPSFTRFIVHIIHGSHHPLFTPSIVHIIHCSHHPLFTSFIVHIIHCSHHSFLHSIHVFIHHPRVRTSFIIHTILCTHTSARSSAKYAPAPPRERKVLPKPADAV